MELRHLRYFVVAAEEVHFGRAARRLNISQPALGLQIRELEEELGITLFDRLPRGVRLTAVGETMLADTRRLLAELEHMLERAQHVARGQSGTLRIGHLPMSMLAHTGAADLIHAYCVKYPSVVVETLDLTTTELVAALDEARIDVAIFYGLTGDEFALRRELLEETVLDGALLPVGNPLARQDVLHCADLAALPWLNAPATASPLNDAFVQEFRARGLEVKTADTHINDVPMRMRLVADGVGWLLSGHFTPPPAIPGIVFRQWADPPIPFRCFLFWNENNHSTALQNFISLGRELRTTRQLPKSASL
jgi:DNA-binding transcriptional LysR family regulator